MKQKKLIITFLILIIYYSISFILFEIIKWTELNFKGITINEIIFHILSPQVGVAKEIKIHFIKNISIYNLLVFIFFIIFIVIFFILKKNILILKSANIILFIFSTNNVLLCLDSLIMNFRLDRYLSSYFEQTEIYKKEYIDPANIEFRFPEQKRNLILIFLESMESTFFRTIDGGDFNEDLIPELRDLALNHIHFSDSHQLGGAIQLNGTGWTIAGIVSQTLGIPLNIPIFDQPYKKPNHFLPNVIGLTDILSQAGYQQRFLIGSDKEFANRDIFFETHGNVMIKDLNYYKSINKLPKDYFVWWGFEDEKLYQFAKEELLELSSKSEPFNLILLTVDTHFFDGYLSSSCQKKFDAQYKNVLACASKQVAGFVKWIQKQHFYKNTTIVIVGDHLYMDGSFVSAEANRRIFNVFINPASKPVKNTHRKFSSFDIFPSILDSIGVEYNAPGLGLGRSLFKDTVTLLEKYNVEYINQEIIKRSKEYNKFILFN